MTDGWQNFGGPAHTTGPGGAAGTPHPPPQQQAPWGPQPAGPQPPPGGAWGGPPPPGPPHGAAQRFAPPVGGGPGHPGAPGQPFNPPPVVVKPARRNRTKLFVAIGAVVTVVALVAAGVLVFTRSKDAAGAATPKEAARAYLEALERGDAKSALALTSFSPPDTTFVTDEVLRKQQEKFPIRNIRVLGEDTNLVHVVFDIGDDVYDGYMTVTPPADGKGWLVAEGVMSVEFHVDKMSPELAKWITLFDQPIPSSRIAYIFPGYIGLGSANPNLIARSWNERPSGLMFILGEESVRPQIEVSDEGKKFIEDQLRAAVEECAKSPNSSPNCPNGRAYTPYFVEGTAKWRLEKLTDVRVYPINTETGAVDVSARAEFTVTGRGINRYAPDSDEVSIFMTATVDFTQDPPKFELKG